MTANIFQQRFLQSLSDDQLDALENAQISESQQQQFLQSLSDDQLKALEQNMISQGQGGLERAAAQLSVGLLAATASVPRFALEIPEFFGRASDIVAERAQQLLDRSKVPGAVDGPSLVQRLFPSIFQEREQKPEEEIFKPSEAIGQLIPESFKEQFQSFKEQFPTFEESKAGITEQLTDPDSFLNKIFTEERNEFEKDPLEIETLLTPRDAWEQTQERAISLGVPSAFLGAGAAGPTVTGFGLGIGDSVLERKGVSEDDRILASLILGPFIHKGVDAVSNKLSGGRSIVPGIEQQEVSAAFGGDPGQPPPGGASGLTPENAVSAVANSRSSPTINSPTDLMIRIFSPRLKHINLKQLRIAEEQGINPTLASITKGGLLQFGANNLYQNFLTKKFFDNAVERMSSDISTAIDRQIETMSPNDFLQISRISQEKIGELPFRNPVKNLAKSFSDEALTTFETGDKVQTRLNEIADQLKKESGDIFKAVKSDQDMGSIVDIEKVENIAKNIKFEKGKVLKRSAESEEFMTLLDEFINFFENESLSIRDAISQIEEMNKLIDFNEFMGSQSKQLIPIRTGLIKAVEKSLKDINRSDLFDAWNEAKAKYRTLAENFGRENRVVFDALKTQKQESIIKKGMSRSGLEAYLKAFSQSKKNEPAYFNLQRKIVEKIAGENSLAADTLSNFQKSNFTREKVARLNELKPILQMDAQMLVGEIANLTETIENGISRDLEMSAIRNDILTSLAKGKIPGRTLQTMSTLQGINLVRQALSQTPEAVNFLRALEKQKAREIMLGNSVGPNGEINLSNINKSVNNPKNIEMLKTLMGEERYKTVSDIGKFVDKAIKGDRNFRNFSQTATTQQNVKIIKNIITIGGLFFAGKFLPALEAGAIAGLSFGAMYGFAKLYTNPRFIRSISRVMQIAAKSKPNPANARIYNSAIQDVVSIAKDELSEEEFNQINK